MPSRRSIVDKLRWRARTGALRGFDSGRAGYMFKTCPKRLWARLSSLAPPSALIGHVYMGFSLCGRYVLSYSKTELPAEAGDGGGGGVGIGTRFQYALQWWAYRSIGRPFGGPSRTELLFGGRGLLGQLYLTLSQQTDGRYLMVGTPRVSQIASSPSCPPSSSMICHADLLMFDRPDVRAATLTAVKLTFPLHAPFPLYEPTVMDCLAGSVALNTGTSILVIALPNVRPGSPRNFGATGIAIRASQHFRNGGGGGGGGGGASAGCRRGFGDGFATVVAEENGEILDSDDGLASDGDPGLHHGLPPPLCVEQTRFDMETLLQQVLAGAAFRHIEGGVSLCDYDLRVVLIESDLQITCNLRALVYTASMEQYAASFVLLLQPETGAVTVLAGAKPVLYSRGALSPKESIASLARWRATLRPCPRRRPVHSMTNMPVFTNKSVPYLRHPFQPIAIIL